MFFKDPSEFRVESTKNTEIHSLTIVSAEHHALSREPTMGKVSEGNGLQGDYPLRTKNPYNELNELFPKMAQQFACLQLNSLHVGCMRGLPSIAFSTKISPSPRGQRFSTLRSFDVRFFGFRGHVEHHIPGAVTTRFERKRWIMSQIGARLPDMK
ncbi:hypothetical protein PG995_005121 [Apiospora arundinis]